MILDGDVVDVPRSTEEALRYLRLPDRERIVWIDAVCINQNDLQERSSQVSIMGAVYGNATRTLVWLGPSDAETFSAYQRVEVLLGEMKAETRDFADVKPMLFSKEGLPILSDTLTEATDETVLIIRAIFERPWFGRVWVIQDASLAPECSCRCGVYEMPMVDILRAALWMKYKYTFVSPQNRRSRVALNRAYYICRYVDREIGLTNMRPRNGFAEALRTFTGFRATDARDNVFGLLGIATSRNIDITDLIKPDYFMSTNQVFRDATLFSIQEEQDLWSLCLVRPRENDFNAPRDPDWVSWVLNWNRPIDLELDPFHFVSELFKAGGHSIPQMSDNLKIGESRRTLGLPGVIVDSVQAVSRRFSSVDFRTDILEGLRQHASMLDKLSQRTSVVEEKSILARTLCAGTNFERTCACARCMPSYGAEFHTWLQLYKDGGDFPARVMEPIIKACSNRRLFVTSQYVGLGPAVMQEGDVVAVLLGAPMPFVLRPRGPEHYLLGQCYVHKIMFGEILKEIDADRSQLETIMLR